MRRRSSYVQLAVLLLLLGLVFGTKGAFFLALGAIGFLMLALRFVAQLLQLLGN